MRRAGPVSWAGSVCPDLGTSVKHNKNQLCDYTSARLAGIPASSRLAELAKWLTRRSIFLFLYNT